MLGVVNKIKNMKVRTKIRLLVGLGIAVIVLFTMQIMSISEKIGTYVGLTAEELAVKSKAIVAQGIVTGLVFEVMLIALGVFVSKSIGKNLKKIVTAIKIVGDGGIEVEITKDSNDEFGEIIDAINEMVVAVKHDARLAYNISEGDLSMDVQPRTDIDVLGMAFKKLVDDNNHILGNIREASMQVTTGSEQVASASQSLAQGSTEQASALEEVTASIGDIADRTKANAEQANNANKLVHEAKEGAVKEIGRAHV